MHGYPYGKIPRFGRTLNERLDDADDDVLHHHHHLALNPKPDGTPYSVALLFHV
jgi:hypothetical protein